MLDAITNQYRKQLISHCSSLPLDGFPAAGEMFYQRISLDDVFVPLRLSKPERTEELLEKNAEYYQIADSEINAGNTVNATDTHTANGIASKKKEQINRTALLSDPSDDEVIAESDISDFIDFLDAQIRKPLSVDNDELDVFLWQIDEQLKKLSSEESKSASFALKQSSASKDCLLSAEEPDTNANSISAQRKSADSNMEAEILLREQRKKYECLPVGPVLDNYASRTVLLALPGCGKTTLAKRIALAYATGNIDCLESYHLPEGMVPLLLYCRSLNEEAFDEGHDFIQIAYKMFCNQFPLVVEDIGVFERMLNYHLEANKLLLIIDGLDEVLSVEKQELFAKRLLSYLSNNRKAHLILTSRLASYVNDDQSTRYIDQIPQIRRNRILPMSMEQIDHFVQKWHDVLYPNDVSKRKNAESISVQLRQPAFKYLKKMIQIPLHLANIILVAKEYGRIPNDKVQLYEDYLKIALNWNTPGNIQSTDLKIALSYLAYHMTKTEHLRFDRVSLEKLLLKCSVDLDCELRTPIDENNVQLIIDQLEERTCVIQKHGQKAGYFEFSHKNLQEYLAAYAIPKGYTEDLYLPTDFVAKHYRKTAWREVIILITLSVPRMQRLAIISFLINEAETNEDTYHATNILFELIANGVQMNSNQKHAIYDLIFKEHITDTQIIQIGELVEDSNAEEFKQYIQMKFNESVQTGENHYAFAMAAITVFELLKNEQIPLEEAQKLVMQSSDTERITGLYIFSLLSWCQYCNIKGAFPLQIISLSERFESQLHQLLRQESKYLSDAATALKDMVLAGYDLSEAFFDYEIFENAIRCLEAEKLTDAAEKILSVFPVNYLTLTYCMKNHLQPLRAKYISKYREHLMNPEKAKETVFLFSVCLMLGCWEFSSEAYLEEFAVLEVYYLKNRRFIDDAAKCKMKMLRKQFSDMADPLSAGLAYHQYAEYEKAKAAFTIAYEHGNTTVCNNLAYMLRRGEVDEVILENRSYTVEELLAEGIARKEPFSLVNYALYCSLQTTSFDYYKGLLIVKQIESPSVATMNRIYTWWEALANEGDAEGYIVIAWLLELGLISDTSLGSLHELKTRIGI